MEIPDRDEEQLPFSLRIVMERGGAVCSIACQTEEDLINLRRGNSTPSARAPPLSPQKCSWISSDLNGACRTRLTIVLGYCLNDEGVFCG